MNLAVYIHWPFCVSKCPYCDFNSHVGDTQNQENWRAAYRREIETYAALLPGRTITSIFFGGGTPSLMEAKTVASVLDTLTRVWRLDDNVEITLEANPSSAEAKKFSDFRAIGIDRLSLGVQSLRDEALKFLGRAHDSSDAKQAIELARQNFPRFSFDLIYAYQGQTPLMWQEELTEALLLTGDHLSLYQLTIEAQTQFHTRTRRGETLTALDDDASAMYELTQEMMDRAGLPAYEVSNHARKGQESRHNMTYWRYDDYIGIGPGAHGRFFDGQNRHATENHKAPDIWLSEASKQGQGIKLNEIVSAERAMKEALMMGLRVSEGIKATHWSKKFDIPLSTYLLPKRLMRLSDEGYIRTNADGIAPTRAGMQRLNAVINYLD